MTKRSAGRCGGNGRSVSPRPVASAGLAPVKNATSLPSAAASARRRARGSLRPHSASRPRSVAAASLDPPPSPAPCGTRLVSRMAAPRVSPSSAARSRAARTTRFVAPARHAPRARTVDGEHDPPRARPELEPVGERDGAHAARDLVVAVGAHAPHGERRGSPSRGRASRRRGARFASAQVEDRGHRGEPQEAGEEQRRDRSSRWPTDPRPPGRRRRATGSGTRRRSRTARSTGAAWCGTFRPSPARSCRSRRRRASSPHTR